MYKYSQSLVSMGKVKWWEFLTDHCSKIHTWDSLGPRAGKWQNWGVGVLWVNDVDGKVNLKVMTKKALAEFVTVGQNRTKKKKGRKKKIMIPRL